MLLDASLRLLAMLGGAVGSFCKQLFRTRRRHGSLQLFSRFSWFWRRCVRIVLLQRAISRSAVFHQMTVLVEKLLCANAG